MKLHRRPSVRPKAVIFDTDNTLYQYEPPHRAAMNAVRLKVAGLTGVDPKKFDEVFSDAREQIKRRLGKSASSHSRLLYLQRTLELLGLRTQVLMSLDLEQTYWRTFLSHSNLFPDVKEFLIAIKSSGTGTAILTDLTAQIQFRKIVYFGLEGYFDYVVTSEEAGNDKPHAATFELALEKLRLPSDQVWMIGDDCEADIAGARRQNIFSLQKIHAGVKTEKTGDGVPEGEFSDYSDLRDLWNALPAS